MEDLAAQALPTIPHVIFSIFNITIPNLIVWGVLILVLLVGSWARLPRFIERGRNAGRGTAKEA